MTRNVKAEGQGDQSQGKNLQHLLLFVAFDNGIQQKEPVWLVAIKTNSMTAPTTVLVVTALRGKGM